MNILSADRLELSVNSKELDGLEYLAHINHLSLHIASSNYDELFEDIEHLYLLQEQQPVFINPKFNMQLEKIRNNTMEVSAYYAFLDEINHENYRIGDVSEILFEDERTNYFLGSLVTHYMPEYFISLYLGNALVKRYIEGDKLSKNEIDILFEQRKLIYLSSSELYEIIELISQYENIKEMHRSIKKMLDRLSVLKNLMAEKTLFEMDQKELAHYFSITKMLISDSQSLHNETHKVFKTLLLDRDLEIEKKILAYSVLLFFAYLVSAILYIYFHKIMILSYKKDEELKKNARELDDLIVFTKTDVEGRITYVSHGFEELTGYSKIQLLGKTHRIFRHKSTSSSFYKEMWKRLSEGKEWKGEIQNLNKDGEVYWEDLHIIPDKNMQGQVIGYTGYRKNINYQKALESQKEQTQKALDFKSRFLSNMSHEIRTPLNSIVGITQLVLKSKLDAKQKEMLSRVNSASSLLMGVINDILDFSKIEAGELKIENTSFNLETLSEDIMSMFSEKAIEKGIYLDIDLSELKESHLLGDPLRISQVLTNLLSNAIKFTNKGSVELIIKSRDNNRIYFEVKDSGIGLKKEAISNLFEEFVQADMSTSRQYGGTGLGLSISKNLVELMGGSLRVESIFGSGSSFMFTIEMIVVDSESEGDIAGISSEELEYNVNALNDVKILIAEDNKMNRDLISMFLEDAQLNITYAHDGLDAVKFAQEIQYDMIFMDIQMPNMNGYDATKTIRIEDKETPIIGLSANVMKEDIEAGLEAGMNAYLFKPLDVDKFYSTILKYGTKD